MNHQNQKQDKIWACLLHLSFNMWDDYVSPERPHGGFRSYLRLDESLWHDAIQAMAKNGLNMVIIDLGDAILYESHPEIAVSGAWSTQKLREELKKIRDLGIEPIPKLNFSAGHDTWLKEYSRMVSTDKYYEVCADLIGEVCDLFDKPRFFHIGMDEETYSHQSRYKHIVIRQNDVWWGDFYFLVAQVEKNGSRAWIWSDYVWRQPELFYKKMPKSVVQSNWYYRTFDTTDEKEQQYINSYLELNRAGYDQIPTGAYLISKFYPSLPASELNIGSTVDFCKKNLDEKLLFGFLQTNWALTVEANRDWILKSIGLLGEAKKHYFNI